MKLAKAFPLIILFIIFTIISVVSYYYSPRPVYVTPLNSVQSGYYHKLNFALKENNIQPISQLSISPDLNRATFDYQSAHIILSTNKDPYLQSASLQKIFQIATIKGSRVRLIDLSLNHPYATFQNN